MNQKKGTLFKNDLKHFDKTDNLEFENEEVSEMYEKYKNKPKIELRIDEAKRENYEYFDLSNLKLDDELCFNLLNLKNIKEILSKIYFLDLSENRLTQLPDLSSYPNIKCITISRNRISGTITNHNFV